MKPRTLLVRRLSAKAQLPTRGSRDSAGWDLCSARDLVIPPNSRDVVDTDLAFVFPPGCYGRIAARSGLAKRSGVDVGAGVVDPDYRGGVAVLLFNHSRHYLHINRGDRIAQLVLERYVDAAMQEVSDLPPTQRGDQGFGSTDAKSEG